MGPVMSKPFKPGRQSVELRPSKIRREPPAPAPQPKTLQPYPTEREAWTVALGVILFAIAVTIITLGISDITS